jgi:septum formation protein
MKIILASASPRRAQLLSQAGLPFVALPADVDESRLSGELAAATALRLAEAKARAAVLQLAAPRRRVREQTPEDTREEPIVIGADTIVELDGDALGKPGSAEAARAMLRRLSGRSHRVITGVAVIGMRGGHSKCAAETTEVHFAALSTEEIKWYVETGEPLDKAGGYAIQGLGCRFVERIEGCYFNVVGLPLRRVYRMLQESGWRPDP